MAFRYRPRTSEAPVAQMPEGTALHILSIEDGWCRARVAGMEAWVAEADVQVVPSDPEIIAAHAEFAGLAKAEVQVRLDKIATELYFGYRNHELDRSGASIDDIRVVVAGLRVKF